MYKWGIHNTSRRCKIYKNMGTGIKFYLAILVLFLSCGISKQNKKSNTVYFSEEDYLKAYKTVILSGCLIEGTNGEFSNFLIKNNDLGLFTEVEMLFHSTVSIADSIGRIHAKKIIPFTYGDGNKKIPIFSECVRYALSKEIDSLAKEKYKQYLRSNKF